MRVRMLRTIIEREGDGFTRYEKGTIWNVSAEQGEAWITGDASGAPIAELAADTPKGAAVCVTSIVGETDTCLMVDVGVSLNGGAAADDDPPHVRLESLSGAEQLEGPAKHAFAPAPARYRFAKGAGSGSAVFLSQCTGFESRSASLSITANPELAAAPAGHTPIAAEA